MVMMMLMMMMVMMQADAAPQESLAGHVSAFGPGLNHGVAGQPCHFTIVTKDAGAGQHQCFSINKNDNFR